MKNAILLHTLEEKSVILNPFHFLCVEEVTNDEAGSYSNITLLPSLNTTCLIFQVREKADEIINILDDNFLLLHSITIEKNPIILNSSHFLYVTEVTENRREKYSSITILESVAPNRCFKVNETPEMILHLLNTN